jgi:hypothetical protein
VVREYGFTLPNAVFMVRDFKTSVPALDDGRGGLWKHRRMLLSVAYLHEERQQRLKTDPARR